MPEETIAIIDNVYEAWNRTRLRRSPLPSTGAADRPIR
jgi:hypothetical protein